MPSRSALGLREISAWRNLSLAFARAARGKRRRPEVRTFEARLDRELAALGEDIRAGKVEVGRYRTFRIFDPKPRTIHAPSFRERVLHHALMNEMGPVLDRSLTADTFACREGKGAWAAVARAQGHSRAHPFFVKIDIRSYFASIEHGRVLATLARRFKAPGLLELCARVLDGHHASPGRGLPIGALTSQWFANLYLDPLDRWLSEHPSIQGWVRYMDDIAWWVQDGPAARESLDAARTFLEARLELTLHPRAYVQRSAHGLSFLGLRIFPHTRRLSRRRKLRYRRARAQWEAAFRQGLIDAAALQAGLAGPWSALVHADAAGFGRSEMARFGVVDA